MKKLQQLRDKLEDIWDDILWEIAMFLKHGPAPDGFFASIITPAVVAFITAAIVIYLTHHKG